jgi:hypothetical protein
MHFFPYTTNESYDETDGGDHANGGGYGSITDYEPSIYNSGSRTNTNSWNGYMIHESGSGGYVEIVTTGGRNNTPCLKMTYPIDNGWIEDISIIKWLGRTKYQEIYLRFYFKYDSDKNWQWNGSVSGGDPAHNMLWKQLRIWTGFNPIDIDKTGGQTLPYNLVAGDYLVASRERNWGIGIWVPRISFTDWGPANAPFIDQYNWTWSPACVYGVGEDGSSCGTSCDSQTCPNPVDPPDSTHCGLTTWFNSAEGHVTTWCNSGNGLDSEGRFTENQDWHCIEYHFKNRSNPTASDGDFELWIDGVLLSSPGYDRQVAASMSLDADDYGINYVQIMGNSSYMMENADGNQYFYIDDVVISTTGPIGPANGSENNEYSQGLSGYGWGLH